MRYQVPQFVDVEDKVVGPLTLRQFFIYLGSALSLIPLYLIVDFSLFITLALPVMGFAVLFAHFRVHGKSLFAVIANVITYMIRGQLFLWRRTEQPRFMFISGQEYGDFSDEVANTGLSRLSEYARALETEGRVTHEDAPDPLVSEEKK